MSKFWYDYIINAFRSHRQLIERGGGKVLGYVFEQDTSQKPKVVGLYIFADKEKLNKAWIEALSNPVNYKPAKHPELWYRCPDIAMAKSR